MAVHNVGTGSAADATVTVALPAGLAYSWEWADSDGSCAYDAAATAWRCVDGQLAPGEYTTNFALVGVVTAAPGSTITATATVTTTSPDASAANDSAQATAVVVG